MGMGERRASCAALQHRSTTMWSASQRRRERVFHRALEALESRRLFSAGELDTAFAGGTVNRGFIPGDELAFSIALQSDGKVLIAGRADSGGASGNDFALARFNADGSVDTTFGSGGMVVTNMGSASDSINAIAIQSDGKIVVAGDVEGSFSATDFGLARYNSNGTLDT